MATAPKRSGQKPLSSGSNLANLLPTGTVLAFEALMPSFSFDGTCQTTNKYLTACLISICALTCFLSSFTDSFFYEHDQKIYYGIATFKSLYIFNGDTLDKREKKELEDYLSSYKIKFIDFVHAFLSVFVFLVFALTNNDVQSCFFPKEDDNQKALIMNMPLGAGVLAGFLFSIFPTSRRGIGYGDIGPDKQESLSCNGKDPSVAQEKSLAVNAP